MSLLIAFPLFEIPLGLLATLIVMALVARRVLYPSTGETRMTQEIPALG
jgi:hypothetical protein